MKYYSSLVAMGAVCLFSSCISVSRSVYSTDFEAKTLVGLPDPPPTRSVQVFQQESDVSYPFFKAYAFTLSTPMRSVEAATNRMQHIARRYGMSGVIIDDIEFYYVRINETVECEERERIVERIRLDAIGIYPVDSLEYVEDHIERFVVTKGTRTIESAPVGRSGKLVTEGLSDLWPLIYLSPSSLTKNTLGGKSWPITDRREDIWWKTERGRRTALAKQRYSRSGDELSGVLKHKLSRSKLEFSLPLSEQGPMLTEVALTTGEVVHLKDLHDERGKWSGCVVMKDGVELSRIEARYYDSFALLEQDRITPIKWENVME